MLENKNLYLWMYGMYVNDIICARENIILIEFTFLWPIIEWTFSNWLRSNFFFFLLKYYRFSTAKTLLNFSHAIHWIYNTWRFNGELCSHLKKKKKKKLVSCKSRGYWANKRIYIYLFKLCACKSMLDEMIHMNRNAFIYLFFFFRQFNRSKQFFSSILMMDNNKDTCSYVDSYSKVLYFFLLEQNNKPQFN